jgi:hypothetical protein
MNWLVIVLVAIVIYFLISNSLREGASFSKEGEHPGFGGYPASLYGEEPSNKYYSEDLKKSLRQSNHFSGMAGLKMPVFDVNDYLETGLHNKENPTINI